MNRLPPWAYELPSIGSDHWWQESPDGQPLRVKLHVSATGLGRGRGHLWTSASGDYDEGRNGVGRWKGPLPELNGWEAWAGAVAARRS